MTEPGRLATPRAAPETRRAARAMREEAERRARAAETQPPTDAFVAFELPSEEFVPASVSDAAPAALPPDLLPVAPAPAAAGTAPRGASAASEVPPLPPRSRARAARQHRPAPSERRAARAAELLSVHEDALPMQHARPRRVTRRIAVVAGLATGAALLLGSAAMTAMMLPSVSPSGADAALSMTVQPQHVDQLPVPQVEQSPPAADICALPDVVAAVQAGDDEAAIVAAGGGEAFRAAVVEGRAPCVNLGDSARTWTVVDKIRPTSPIDYRPSGLVLPDGVRNVEGGALRSDAATALASLVTGARSAGVGEIALESGFRSYQTQQQTYGRHFAERGERADQVSARPGYSEHQLGLAADVVACAGACGTLDDLAATAQGQWIADHAWEHGWIVRYVEGATPVTGYLPEPWHLRYIGPELAKSYHDGGWTSLEEFFALDPAPAYLG
ncbi:M15 family metallopeptidase [Microbacterium sp. LWS13-1.2]|uniref:M15 family metallopeptidase n=1 Tax=Microbacterium sp. LWS13-1.2 TaxID=3135264 RepID=A0AAU6SDU7_9MICO